MAKYLKMNSKKGFIEDTAEIAHVKFNNMRHVVLGFMLGDFDSQGEYFVRPDIVEELIKMDKHIIDSVDNIDICESFLKLDKPITFAITFQNDKATLSLLEKINHGANFKLNAGSYSDVNEYILAEIETSGAVDKNVVYRMWNVKLSGGEALDVFHMDEETLAKFAGVVRRFKYLLVANKKLLQKEEKIEEIEAAYFNKMMSLLARYPKLKIAVEKEIKNQFDEKTGMLRLDKPNLMKTMNEIVLDAIEDNIDLLDEKEKESFEAEKHNIENEYNIEITKEIDISNKKVEQKDLNADPITVPVIETFGEEDKKSAEELAKEFVEEENNVETRVQDDMVTLATGKEAVSENKKTTEKEESKNLIAESIKGDTDKTKNNNLSGVQEAFFDEANRVKNPKISETYNAKKKIMEIATGEKVVAVPEKGLANINEDKQTKVEEGKKKIPVSKTKINAFLEKTTGEDTQKNIQKTQEQAVAKVDDKTKDKAEEKQAEAKKDNKLVKGAAEQVKTNKKPTITTNKNKDKKEISEKPTNKKGENKNNDDNIVKSPGGYFPVNVAKQTKQDKEMPESLRKIIEENNKLIEEDKFNLDGVKSEEAVEITAKKGIGVSSEKILDDQKISGVKFTIEVTDEKIKNIEQIESNGNNTIEQIDSNSNNTIEEIEMV